VADSFKPKSGLHHGPVDFVSAIGDAAASGTASDVSGASDTFLGGGMAGGIAGFMAEAQNVDASPAHTLTETQGATGGGDMATSQTGRMSGDLNFGHTAFSGSDSVTFVSAVDLAPLQLTSHDNFSPLAEPAYGHIA
jgi:hypothetical protein